MLAIPRKVKGITHPLIDEIYLKKEISEKNDIKNILVIMTQKNCHQKQDLGVLALLADLGKLQAKIEKTIGNFDRVDIKNAT